VLEVTAKLSPWQRRKERDAREEMWRRRRADLKLGEPYSWDRSDRSQLNLWGRAKIGALLGLSVRTLDRYEREEAPAWYDRALVGLAVELGRLKVKRQKKKR
jgi:hypothetical protein